jgi:hypothetical protein
MESRFAKAVQLAKANGSIWIFDPVLQSDTALQKFIYKNLYGNYLPKQKNSSYGNHVV